MPRTKSILRSMAGKALVAAFLVLLVLAYINARPRLPPPPGLDFDENPADSRPPEKRHPNLWAADIVSSKGAKRQTTPANPNATLAARNVLAYIANLPSKETKRVLSGQNLGHGKLVPSGYTSYVTRLAQASGQLRPAILGADYGWNTIDAEAIPEVNRPLIHHWKRGGLITLHCNVGNPFHANGRVQDDKADVDLTELLNPQSPVYASWISRLDMIASGLEELRDAGVVVLWRPFHEMNGGWFWWCNDDYKGEGWTPREDFVALWRHMFDYFTRTKKLDNLLWVYSPNAQLTPEIRPTDFYYPGSDYVDIVGYDLYYWKPLDAEVFDMNGSYSRLAALNKPFGLCEFGPGPGMRNGKFDNRTLIDGIRDYCPNACFFFYWASWSNDLVFYRLEQRVAMIDNDNAPALLADPWVITRDEVGE